MYPRGVRAVLVAECGGEIAFFRRYQYDVAGDEGREEEHEHPREIARQRDPDQDTDAAEVERIPRDGENTVGDEPGGGTARIGGLAVPREPATREDDERRARDDEGRPSRYS